MSVSGPLKNTFVRVFVDGSQHSAHDMYLRSPLHLVRKDLNLAPSLFFMNGESPIKDQEDENQTTVGEIITPDQKLHLRTLKPGDRYGSGSSTAGSMRSLLSFQGSTSQAPSSKLLPGVKLLDSNKNGLKIYQYPHKVPKKDPNYPSAEVLPASRLTNAKYIIVMGASGAGKTRMLDCLTNYMQGIQREDGFRYQLVVEGDGDGNKVCSQTQNTTFYCIESQIGLPPFVVVDTRGFADTRGTAEDEKTDAQLANLFQNHTEKVHLVCFVIKSNETRLGDREKYVFANVLKFFSKNSATHFRFLLTFKDTDETPEVLNLLKAKDCLVAPTILTLEKAAIDWCYFFNNSAVYRKVEDTSAHREFWKFYQNYFSKFVKMVQSSSLMDLEGTRQTIKNREKLNLVLTELRKKSVELEAIGSNPQEAIGTLSQNFENFTAKSEEVVEFQEERWSQIPVTHNTTYCPICRNSCHEVCYLPLGSTKEECASMCEQKCTKCINKCPYAPHYNSGFVVKLETVKVYKTRRELRDEHFTASERQQLNSENSLDLLLKKYDQTMATYLRCQEETLTATNELTKLALVPVCFDSMSGYLETQMRNEKANKEAGWEKRYDFIQQAWLRNEFAMNAIKNGDVTPGCSVHQALQTLLDQKRYSNRAVLEQWISRNKK